MDSTGAQNTGRIDVLSILTDNFSILRKRDLRVYLSGQSVSLIGDWMQQTAQAWVVWDLTHSAAALGIVAFFTQIPYFIFGPWVGVVSDRFPRRRILIVTQLLIMSFAFVLAFLEQTHRLQLWHVYILATSLGVVSAFDTTAEQAFIGDIAGEGNIGRAIALNNSLTQLTRLVGPSLAGYLIASVGVASSFWLNGLSIGIALFTIVAVHPHIPVTKPTGDGFKEFIDGWRFYGKNKTLRLLVIFAGVQAFFGFSLIQILPAVAVRMLHGDSNTLGKLLGAAGAGALVGIVLVLPFVERIRKTCFAIGGALAVSGAGYILFSRTQNPYLAMGCQFIASLGASNVVTLTSSLLQELTPPQMRARILSTFMMIIFGLQPLASWLVGKGAEHYDLPATILFNGCVMVVFPVFLLMIPRLYHLRRPAAREVQPCTDHCIGF